MSMFLIIPHQMFIKNRSGNVFLWLHEDFPPEKTRHVDVLYLLFNLCWRKLHLWIKFSWRVKEKPVTKFLSRNVIIRLYSFDSLNMKGIQTEVMHGSVQIQRGIDIKRWLQHQNRRGETSDLMGGGVILPPKVMCYLSNLSPAYGPLSSCFNCTLLCQTFQNYMVKQVSYII
jgi:hypothetical protein